MTKSEFNALRCNTKRRYTKKSDAKRAAARSGNCMEAYLCGVCQMYHVGHYRAPAKGVLGSPEREARVW